MRDQWSDNQSVTVHLFPDRVQELFGPRGSLWSQQTTLATPEPSHDHQPWLAKLNGLPANLGPRLVVATTCHSWLYRKQSSHHLAHWGLNAWEATSGSRSRGRERRHSQPDSQTV